MAINDTRTFDPSRRIRAALGEEYTNNLEGEAIARLSAAMASNAIRKTKDYTEEEDNDMRIKEIVGKIVHTNPVKPVEPAKDPVGLEGTTGSDRSAIRVAAYDSACKELDTMLTNDPFKNKIVKACTGIDLSGDKKSKVSEAVKFALKNTSKIVVNNAMETSLKYGNKNGIIACSAIAAGTNMFGQMFFSTNDAKINSMFDPNVITSAEADLIRSTIRKEKFKFAAQHTVATVVAPAAVKLLINKVAEEKISNNKILSVATSFGVLSGIGELGLKAVRKISEKKQLKKLKEELAKSYEFAEVDPIAGYGTIAKVATNHMINSTICDTALGATIGSVIGNGCVTKTFEYHEFEIPEEAIIEKKEDVTVYDGNALVDSVNKKSAIKTDSVVKVSSEKKTA